MAEVALTSIAKSALELFTSLAKDELLLLWKSQEELQKLEQSIETVGSFLHDADKLQSKDDSVQKCLSRLRKVMYEADDLFDALAAKALRYKAMTGNAFKKEVRLFFSKSSNPLIFNFEIAHGVKAIRESLVDIALDMERFSFIKQQRPLVENHQQVIRFDRDRTHSFVHGEDVIGRDTDRDRIINMLLSPDQGEASFDDQSQLSVVAIIGFGGLGKTTLAQFVYNNDKVQKGFDVCLWACINDLSNLEQVLIEIIASKEKRHPDLGLEKLQEKLREVIGSKKFLVVLDDVWDENSVNWLRLEPILRCGNRGSKVLVTTRSVKVAECFVAPKSRCVDLEVLSEESAWSLFVKNAFFKGELISEYPGLEPIGKKIVGRCGNVPLAIIVIGSLLRSSKRREERAWSDFLENELGSPLSISDYNNTQKSISDVLMVSYNNLHPNLKLCFAYCSIFPKGFEFDKDELVYFWISQGFIKPFGDSKQSLEELGEAYFFHLVERCFFQGVECKKNDYYCNVFVGNPFNRYSAKMHDLLHDLAADVAKKENVFIDKGFINGGKGGSFRHICIGSDVVESFSYCKLVYDPSIVRTILCEDRRTERVFTGSLKMLTRFRALRALCLASMGIQSISDSIGELIHLRYLDLSSNKDLKHLPSSICKLHHLLTLVLQDCQLLESLPPKIHSLISLRHLFIDGCHTLESMPKGLIALTSLVNLDRLIVGRQCGGLRYLSELNNLSGGVKIELPEEGWLDAVEDAKGSNMSKKHRLIGMDISWGNDLVSSSDAQTMAKDEAAEVLEALEPPKKLEHLKISNYGGEKISSWFCMLKNIKELRLSGCDHVEYLEVEMKGDPCFPGLKILELAEMKNLKGWWSREVHEETKWPSLPKVSRVFIRDCPELKGKMPLFVGVEDLHLLRVDVKLLEISLPPFDTINQLKEVRLTEIKGLTCFPEKHIRHLTALQILDIEDCTDLQWVSRRGLENLTALKELKLGRCCEIVDEDGKTKKFEVGMPWKMLQGLTTLMIPAGDMHFREGFGHLRLLENLAIGKCEDEKDVELASKAFHGLRTLKIGFDEEKGFDLCKTGIQDLPLLTELWVGGCKKLYVDWKSLLMNTKLKKLVIYCVESVVHVGDMVEEQQSQLLHLKIHTTKEAKWVCDIPWKSLASLRTLSLKEIGGMEEFPEGIQHLSSLVFLFLNGCEQMRTFPSWLPNLSHLMLFQIEGCPLLEQGSPELCALFQMFNAEKHYEHYKLYERYQNLYDNQELLKVINERKRKKEIHVEL